MNGVNFPKFNSGLVKSKLRPVKHKFHYSLENKVHVAFNNGKKVKLKFKEGTLKDVSSFFNRIKDFCLEGQKDQICSEISKQKMSKMELNEIVPVTDGVTVSLIETGKNKDVLEVVSKRNTLAATNLHEYYSDLCEKGKFAELGMSDIQKVHDFKAIKHIIEITKPLLDKKASKVSKITSYLVCSDGVETQYIRVKYSPNDAKKFLESIFNKIKVE